MPINRRLMRRLKEEYGEERGEQVYYALENKMRRRKGRRTAAKKRR